MTQLRFLCLAQNANYKTEINKRGTTFSLLNILLATPYVFFDLFIGTGTLNSVIILLYECVITATLFLIIRNYRTKLKFTRRAKISFACSLALPVAALATCVGVLRENAYLYGIFGCVAIAPVYTAISLAVLNPYFEKKNKKFFDEAMDKLRETHAVKIMITGSYGKTACKNILSEMLKKKYSVIATEGNYNTPMGIAFTVEKMTGKEEVFIAEAGARRRGDIKLLTEKIKPDYSITTGVCPQHLATFKSLHNVFTEKSELSKGTKKVSVFNCNDKYALKIYREHRGGKIMVCCNKEGDVYADNVKLSKDGSNFRLVYGNGSIDIRTKLLGKHNIINITLCAALALEMGVSAEEIKEAAESLSPVPHRLEYIYANGIHILDDSYNSNLVGVRSALEVLDLFPGRKVVLSQGIVEGGRYNGKLNSELGRNLSAHGDVIILCGSNAKSVGAGLKESGFSGKIYRFGNLRKVQAAFGKILRKDDVLFLQNDLPDVY